MKRIVLTFLAVFAIISGHAQLPRSYKYGCTYCLCKDGYWGQWSFLPPSYRFEIAFSGENEFVLYKGDTPSDFYIKITCNNPNPVKKNGWREYTDCIIEYYDNTNGGDPFFILDSTHDPRKEFFTKEFFSVKKRACRVTVRGGKFKDIRKGLCVNVFLGTHQFCGYDAFGIGPSEY